MNQKRHSATSRVTTGRANMAGPWIGGKAGWINPFGFFVLTGAFRLTHLPLTQPCKAETRTLRVNHTRARERGLCSARKDHAKDRTWSSDRGRDDSCGTIGLSVVAMSTPRSEPSAQCVECEWLDARPAMGEVSNFSTSVEYKYSR